jgi:WD40 repeat protein/energy-coupling factor transporter ATP-binding protein EcfA2
MSDKNMIIRPNPFPGLRSFRPDEGHLFFGRMESTLKVVAKLKESGFVAVIGASGSGKSSLVFSGVIPALLRENVEEKKSWSYVVFRPDRNPVDRLASELSSLSSGAGFSQLPENAVAASLHNSTEGLIDVVNKMRKSLRQQIVIVIDQFEELFRYSFAITRGRMEDEATEFIDLLVNAARNPDQGLYIILTVRSEYVSECSRFHTLTSLMNNSSYLLPQISHDHLVSVIEEPIKVAGAAIDRSLVRIILSDLTERPGQLPVLQHLLMQLWNHWSRSGDISRPISIADYEAVGQVKGAISQHAGQAMESLDDRQKYVCSRIFRTITARTDDGRELRKPERIYAIAAQTGTTIEEIIDVAEVFRAPEYSFLAPSKEVNLTMESILDLTHESIIRLWSLLRKWMDEEEASRKLYLQLARAAEQYQEGNGKLWTAPDLLVAVRWREENNPTLAWAEKLDPAFERTMLFLKSSEEEYSINEEYNRKTGTERIKRSRLVAAILGLIAIITLITLGTVFSLRNKAEKQKIIAVQMKDEALAYSERLSDSLENLYDTLETATRQAIIERKNALAAQDRAEMAEKKIVEANLTAKEAVEERTAAVETAVRERQRKMLSLSKSLAVRSLNYKGDQDLQILLARQSWIFNQRYSGPSDDPDVFSALYDVGKRYGNRYYSQFVPDNAQITAMVEKTDGHAFFTADSKGRVMQWQNDQHRTSPRLIWSGDKIIRTMTVSHDASLLACGTETSEIIIIPLNDDSISYQLNSSTGEITSLIFSNERDHLYSSSATGTVKEWDLTTRQNETLSEEPEGVAALELSDDSSLMAALTRNGKVILWKMQAPGIRYTLETGDEDITAHKFIPGSLLLATGDNAGRIEIWDTSQLVVEEHVQGHTTSITNIAFNKEDDQVATTDESGEIRLWTMNDLTMPPVTITDSDSDILHLAFIRGGNAFLTATGAGVTERPAHVRCMTDDLCTSVTRNLSEQEWHSYVGDDIEYEATCPDKALRIRVREIVGAR